MRRKGEKPSFDPERAHVRIEHRVMQSMAYKMLSLKAAWLYGEILAQYRGSYSRLILPYTHVKWRLSSSAFKKAVDELVGNEKMPGGFLKVIKSGGLFKGPTIYSVPDPHQLFNSRDFKARCAALAKDETAGRSVWLFRPNEKGEVKRTSIWLPYPKQRSRRQQESLTLARTKKGKE